MSDWADEEADRLCWYDCGPHVSKDDVASALRAAERRGRAAGMREAALIAHMHVKTRPFILARADAIERGE